MQEAASPFKIKKEEAMHPDIYPKPDRSKLVPNFVKTAENDVLDIGWAEGELSDGRPYRAEYWAQDQIGMVTFFFSVNGMEAHTDPMFQDLLVKEGLVEFPQAKVHLSARPLLDWSGNRMWSVNVVLDAEDGVFARARFPFNRFEKRGD
jgi:hypothetical protein